LRQVSGHLGAVEGGVGAQAGMEHLPRPGRHGEQRLVAAHVGVGELAVLLRKAVGLADRGVEVDGEGRAQLPAEHGLGGTCAQGSGVVDAVAASQRRVDEGEGLQAGVGGAGGAAEMHMLVEERLEAQSLGEGGGKQQAGVGHGVTIGRVPFSMGFCGVSQLTLSQYTGHFEPPRVSWRLQSLRGWSHEQSNEVSGRSAGTRRAHGLRSRARVRLPMGGDQFDLRQARHDGRDPAQVGAPGRDRSRPAAGLSGQERERVKELERDNRELRRAKEILKAASAGSGDRRNDRRGKR